MSVNIRLKHSSTAAKVPLASDLTDGELALNTNSSDPAIYLKDSAGTIRRVDGVKNASVTVSDTAPSGPSNGDLWWNSSATVGTLFIYYTDIDSSQWIETAGSEGGLPIWVRDGATLRPADAGDDIEVGGGNILMNADGSAEFNNQVRIKERCYVGSGAGSSGGAGEAAYLQAYSDTGACLKIDKNTVFNGSSSTAANIFLQCSSSTSPSTPRDIRWVVTSDGSQLIGGNLPGAPAIYLNAEDGKASFAGSNINIETNGSVGHRFKRTTDSQQWDLITSTSAGGFFGIYDRTNTRYAVRYFDDGTTTFSGTVTATIVAPSDVRFKENITPANPQLADVVALGGLLKNYDWNDQAPVNDDLRATRQLGLIAQEAEVICPTLVKTLREGDDTYKGLSNDVLIMKLLGAVAEQNTRIEELEAKLTAAGM